MKRVVRISLAVTLAVSAGILGFNNLKEDQPKYSPANQQSKQYHAGANGAAALNQELYSDAKTGEVNYEYIREQRKKATQFSASRADQVGLEFTFVGPNNVGGRTRAILVDNEDSERIYSAGITGGLFISTNGGNSWSPAFDDQLSINVSSITQADNGTIYVGTGCSFELEGSGKGGGPQSSGTGIYKSTDRGETWTRIDATDPEQDARFSYVNDILVIPGNANNLVAATASSAGSGGGVMISTDGGDSWVNGACRPDNITEYPLEGNSLTITGDGNTILAACIATSTGKIFKASLPLKAEKCFFEDMEPNPNGEPKFPTGISGNRERLHISAGKFVDNTLSTKSEKVYIAAVDNANNGYGGIYVSETNGETAESFEQISPEMPTSSPTWDLFGERRDPGRAGAQGWYDFSFQVAPNNEDKYFIGGVQFWRYDGNWTRATRDFGAGFGDNLYSHVDQHTIAFDPNNANIMYIGNDGGIFKSLDGGYTWWEITRGYQTTQFYDVEASPEGIVVGGTQDNGVIKINPNQSGVGNFGYRVSNQNVVNGDGFDVAISQIVDAKVTSAQFNNVGRSQIDSETGSGICDSLCGDGPFDTRLGFWESLNDEYSRDSITFTVDTSSQKIDLGNGTRRTFSGKLEPAQASAVIDYSSLTIGTIDKRVSYNGDGRFTGSGSGTLDEETGEFEVSLNFSPQQNALINAYYTVNYPAGSTISLSSATEGLPIKAVLPTNLAPGDQIKIQDPVQSVLAMATNSDIALVRGIINFQDDNREWIRVNPGTGRATCFRFSDDGRSLFFGNGSGNVYRMDNVDQLYKPSDASKAQFYQIANVNGRISSIDVHPSDPETVIFTTANTGIDHVYMMKNARSALNQGTSQLTSLQSDLPDLPVFAGIFNASDPSVVILGTDLGIYATSDVNASTVEWTRENDFGRIEFPNVPVYSLYQQKLSIGEAVNSHVIYAGTHGRGIWETGSLVGLEEIDHNLTSDGDLSPLEIFPNPMTTGGTITFNASVNSTDTRLEVFDINGNVVQAKNIGSLEQGENQVRLHTNDLPIGTYIVSVRTGNARQIGKFVVTR